RTRSIAAGVVEQADDTRAAPTPPERALLARIDALVALIENLPRRAHDPLPRRHLDDLPIRHTLAIGRAATMRTVRRAITGILHDPCGVAMCTRHLRRRGEQQASKGDGACARQGRCAREAVLHRCSGGWQSMIAHPATAALGSTPHACRTPKAAPRAANCG